MRKKTFLNALLFGLTLFFSTFTAIAGETNAQEKKYIVATGTIKFKARLITMNQVANCPPANEYKCDVTVNLWDDNSITVSVQSVMLNPNGYGGAQVTEDDLEDIANQVFDDLSSQQGVSLY